MFVDKREGKEQGEYEGVSGGVLDQWTYISSHTGQLLRSTGLPIPPGTMPIFLSFALSLPSLRTMRIQWE